MLVTIDGIDYQRTYACEVRPGDINVDGAKCISARPRRSPSATGREYVDIIWDDAPLVTHVTNADRPIIIEEKDF